MKATTLSSFPEQRFPYVLLYSTLLAGWSLAAIGFLSSHVLR
jgi:hypothetical protein